DNFDMMVIGHLNEAVNIVGNNIREKVIIDCLQNDKGVYCFDDLNFYATMLPYRITEEFKRRICDAFLLIARVFRILC
ncbi:MAG: hypothetical protein PHV04_09085, partial [Clostridia bacterium]|nr:hypothetical protein [Clostridia bacterium]